MEAVYLNLLLYLHAEAPEDQWSFGTPWAWRSSRRSPKVAKLKMGWEETIGFSGTESGVEADTSSPDPHLGLQPTISSREREQKNATRMIRMAVLCAVHPPGLEPGTH